MITMEIKVLGTGCPKCNKLEALVKASVSKLGLDAEITHIRDMDEILSYNVMMTPALVIDGVVRVSGRIPSKDQMEKILQSL